MKNKVKICFLGSLLLCLFTATNVLAEDYVSRTEWGSRDISYEDGNGFGYHRSLSGATWYYYNLKNYTPKSSDETISVPFGNFNVNKVSVPVNTCKSYGGFWALLRNGYTRNENGEITLTGPVAAIRLSDISGGTTNNIVYKDRNGTPSGESQDGISAIKYGTMAEVKDAFSKVIGTTAIPDGITWDNNSSLSYFCAGENPSDIPSVTANFASFSTVSVDNNKTSSAPVINGNSYLSNSLVVTAGAKIKITFNHYVAKSVEHSLENAGISYGLNGNLGAGSSSGNIQTDALNERFYIGGVNYYAGHTSNSIEITADKGETYCQVVTFNGSNSKVYRLADFKIANGGGAIKSSACVTIKVVTVPSDVVSSCTQGDNKGGVKSNFMYGNDLLGNTAATVGVSKNGTLYHTNAADDNDEISIYTKPGDVFQFSYSLCFGAHTVDGGATSNSSRTNVSNVQWNIFNVSAGGDGSDPTEQAKYLYGELSSDLLGQDVYLSGYDAKNGNLSYLSFVTGGQIDNPINQDSGNYITIDNNKRQISFASPESGYVTVDKNSGAIGATISQTLAYNALAAWPECLSKASDGKSNIVCPADENTVDWRHGHFKIRSYDKNAYNNAYSAYQAGYKYKAKGTKFVYYSNDSDDMTKKTAKVVTPYNFDTNVWSEMDGYSDGTVSPGDTVSVSAKIDILPRVNPLTSSKNENGDFVPYATATNNNTRVEVIELLVRDTVDINNAQPYVYDDGQATHTATIKDVLNGNVDPFGKSSICNMYRGYLGKDLGECTSRVVKGNNGAIKKNSSLRVVGNADSNPEGEMGYFDTSREAERITRVIPDVEAGYKYCVAIGINHGDSHGVPGQELQGNNPSLPNYAANSYSVSAGFGGAVKPSWKVSKMSCRTITKEPNFQVWNGGMYSSGNIETSVLERNVNTKLTSNRVSSSTAPVDKDEKLQATPGKYFGSWAEYFVVSKGSVKGFASASALGYTDPFSWSVFDKNGNVVGTNTAYFAATGLGVNSYNFCNSSRLTIANVSCKSSTSGNYATSDTDETVLEGYREKVLNYYTNPENQGIMKETYSSIVDGDSEMVNGAEYLKINGPFTIDTPVIRPSGSGTLVIEVTGHLFIEQNICLGSGICEDASWNIQNWESGYSQNTNRLSLLYDNDTTISPDNLDSIPQVILIAEDISISSDVSQIDAWLITNSKKENYDGGYVNTCREFKNNETSTRTCWKTLKINGPVITSALFLNRTGGSWPGFSGDVGNPAYDVLYEEMQNYITSNVNAIMGNPYHPTNIAASNACAKWKEFNNCKKNKITKIVEEYFLNYRSDGSLRSQEEKDAYKNSGNFSANKKSVAANNAVSRDLSCDGSITPAEIFDLHPIVYYWALAESRKEHQAVVTYAQEFAPRY
ncbi:hypothetical protein IKG48_01680 [Candidatus Saccharibacteria bacterium]|nr:hypothetical protein [Candidatus Saccharibacteria bacterium]